MKTIEERAEKYSNEVYGTLVRDSHKVAYIRGAAEQLEIDIRRAMTWLKDNTVRNAFIDDNGLQNDDWQNSFIQAMKGE